MHDKSFNIPREVWCDPSLNIYEKVVMTYIGRECNKYGLVSFEKDIFCHDIGFEWNVINDSMRNLDRCEWIYSTGSNDNIYVHDSKLNIFIDYDCIDPFLNKIDMKFLELIYNRFFNYELPYFTNQEIANHLNITCSDVSLLLTKLQRKHLIQTIMINGKRMIIFYPESHLFEVAFENTRIKP